MSLEIRLPSNGGPSATRASDPEAANARAGTPPSGPSPFSSAPTAEHLQQIAQARILGTRLRRAASVAMFDGWSVGAFGFLTLVTGLNSIVAILLAAGMAVVANFEIRGSTQLKRLDTTAPRRLAKNQVALGCILFAYGASGLWTSLHAPSEISAIIASEPLAADMLAPYASLERNLYVVVYAVVMAVAIIEPGAMALYYLAREKTLRRYLAQTPSWILDLQRAGLSV